MERAVVESPSLKVFKNVQMGQLGTSLVVNMVALGKQLDSMVFRAFPTLTIP